MAVAKQQQAKGMAQQWNAQAKKIPQSTDRTGDFNQDFVDTRSAQTQQKQKANDDYLYNRQLNDMSLWAQRSESNQISRERAGREADQNQNAFDYNAQLWQRDRAGSKSAGSSANGFGDGAFQPSGYGINAFGQKTAFNASDVADWNLRQKSSLDSTRRFSEAQAAGDVARSNANAEAQGRVARAQADADAAKQSMQNNFNAQEASKDRAAQERMNLLQGYSINPGSFQYWGGRV